MTVKLNASLEFPEVWENLDLPASYLYSCVLLDIFASESLLYCLYCVGRPFRAFGFVLV